jgi:hypothetical protein
VAAENATGQTNHARMKNVPAPVSAIIIKLLAKAPEERYQTAGGVERDLRRCLALPRMTDSGACGTMDVHRG